MQDDYIFKNIYILMLSGLYIYIYLRINMYNHVQSDLIMYNAKYYHHEVDRRSLKHIPILVRMFV